MKIIFLGTPDFAVASLAALLQSGYEIVAVVTSPDKPAGRGQKLNESAVKKFALAHDLKILQPLKLKNEDFVAELKSLKADLQVVVAFRMLPEIIWAMPPKGTINLHGSLLPQYRGAAPINRAIMNGEKLTGVSTFFLQQEIDTGEILFSSAVTIDEQMNAGELHNILMVEGAKLIVKTVNAIDAGTYTTFSQEKLELETELKFAPKLFKEDCMINWHNDTKTIYNQIRGLSPFPTAFTFFGDKMLKIFASIPEYGNIHHAPGEYITDNKTFLKFASADGYLSITELQQEGKKRMNIQDFLRGVKL